MPRTATRIVAAAVPEKFVSAAELAVTVTVAGDGTVAGAVYRPALEIVPHVVPEQPAPDRVQLTDWLEVPETEAANCWVWPAVTVAVGGETATARPVIVTVALPDALPSAWEVPVTVTVAGLGTTGGAV